jgi:hypothetical protein
VHAINAKEVELTLLEFSVELREGSKLLYVHSKKVDSEEPEQLAEERIFRREESSSRETV